MVIIALMVVVAVIVPMTRQMGENGGNFLFDLLLDVVSVNMIVFMSFLNAHNLNRLVQMCPGLCTMCTMCTMCRVCN